MTGLEMKSYNMKLTKKAPKITGKKKAKYEYLAGEEILPPDQSRMIEQAKFSYSPFLKLWKSKLKQLKIKTESK